MTVAALSVKDSQDAFNAILNEIRSGVYRPGDKMMNERDLAEKLKVSRGTVRKALDRLGKDGIVQRRVGSGTFLSTEAVSSIEILDAEVTFDRIDKSISYNVILEARLVIEPGVVAMAANNATPGQIAVISKNLKKIKTASCWLEFKEEIYSFFQTLYAMSNNPFLLSIFNQIIEQRRINNFDGIKLRSKVAPLVCQRTYEDLEQILAPVAGGDAESAERRSREYLLQQYCSQ